MQIQVSWGRRCAGQGPGEFPVPSSAIPHTVLRPVAAHTFSSHSVWEHTHTTLQTGELTEPWHLEFSLRLHWKLGWLHRRCWVLVWFTSAYSLSWDGAGGMWPQASTTDHIISLACVEQLRAPRSTKTLSRQTIPRVSWLATSQEPRQRLDHFLGKVNPLLQSCLVSVSPTHLTCTFQVSISNEPS